MPAHELMVLLRRTGLAAQLEAETAGLRAEVARRRREQRARELVTDQVRAAGVVLPAAEVDDLVANHPVTAAGDLHELAFLALVGHALQVRQFAASIPSIGDPR